MDRNELMNYKHIFEIEVTALIRIYLQWVDFVEMASFNLFTQISQQVCKMRSIEALCWVKDRLARYSWQRRGSAGIMEQAVLLMLKMVAIKSLKLRDDLQEVWKHSYRWLPVCMGYLTVLLWISSIYWRIRCIEIANSSSFRVLCI